MRGVLKTHLYITENGTIIGIDGGRLTITQKNNLIRSIPKNSIESISIFGNSTITTPCIQYLLQEDVPVCYFSNKGKYYGRLHSTSNQRVTLLKNQIQCFEKESFYLPMARKVISAKINNQLIVLKRYVKVDTEENDVDIRCIKQMQRKVVFANEIREMLGYEGMAAKCYFRSLGRIVNEEFKFSGRCKRPPKDPFNSLLSLGYTLLMYEIMAKIESEKMNPFCGFIHKDRDGSPALCSDLMEEWRATLIDSTVLSMVQGNEIHFDDFVTDENTDGVYLSNEGLKKFISKFERKINRKNKYLKYDNNEYTFRQAMHIQSKKLHECINAQEPDSYKSIWIR